MSTAAPTCQSQCGWSDLDRSYVHTRSDRRNPHQSGGSRSLTTAHQTRLVRKTERTSQQMRWHHNPRCCNSCWAHHPQSERSTEASHSLASQGLMMTYGYKPVDEYL